MFHSWDDNNEQYEILGLRALLKAAVSPEEYAKATPEKCREIGLTEYDRQSARDNEIWHLTLEELRYKHRDPYWYDTDEHAKAILAARTAAGL